VRLARKDELLEKLRLSDAVVIVLDIRNPIGTTSSFLLRASRGKQRLFVLNKSDLVPREVSSLWERWFECRGLDAIAVSANSRLSTLRLRKRLRRLARESQKEKFVVIFAGVPKTGKSSLINVLRGRRGASVSAYPGAFGYTKGFTLFNVEGRIYAWDSPGVFPDVRDPLERLIRTRPPEKIKNPEVVAARLLKRVKKFVPGSVATKYGVDESLDEFSILEEIARKMGWLEKSTKEPILEQAGLKVIRDYLSGELEFYVRPRDVDCLSPVTPRRSSLEPSNSPRT